MAEALAEALSNEEGVGRDTQGGVMMETHPAAPLIVREVELLLEFLIIALDAPAHLGHEDKLFQCGLARTGQEDVFGGFGLKLYFLPEMSLSKTTFCDAHDYLMDR